MQDFVAADAVVAAVDCVVAEAVVATGEERTVDFSVFSTHNKRDTSYPGG